MPKIGMADDNKIIPIEIIERRIYVIRGQKVMLDSDLAELYGIETRRLNEQVTRNIDRFPDDFMFKLSPEERDVLNRSQIETGSQKHRDPRFLPRVFTQEGLAMLSGVLRSGKAIEVNIAIMRTFVYMREFLATHKDLADKINEHDGQIAYLFEQVEKLMVHPEPPKNPIGYVPDEDNE